MRRSQSAPATSAFSIRLPTVKTERVGPEIVADRKNHYSGFLGKASQVFGGGASARLDAKTKALMQQRQMTMRTVTRWLLGLSTLILVGLGSDAAPPRQVTDTALLVGDWQSFGQRLNIQCLPNGRAIVELELDDAAQPRRIATGSYQAIRPGLYRFDVQEPDHTRHVLFATFEDSYRLVVTEGATRTFRMFRAGRSFDDLDTDNDGYISWNEAKGSPLARYFQEFGGGERKMLDRAAYERFLAKYPHLGSAK